MPTLMKLGGGLVNLKRKLLFQIIKIQFLKQTFGKFLLETNEATESFEK
jgi:hypothetical protein